MRTDVVPSLQNPDAAVKHSLQTARRLLLSLVALLAAINSAIGTAIADVTLTEGTNLSADVRADGSSVTDLLGGLWLIPPGGGEATRLPNDLHPARQPRFSADGRSILYVAEQGRNTELWIYDLDAGTTAPIAADWQRYAQPDWHPSGERIVFAAHSDDGSNSNDGGFAIWEMDVATGLRWRLTHGPGEATWPAWSEDGKDLVYVRRRDDRYELILRRLGQTDEILFESAQRLSAPSFRPDKSLVTVIRHADPLTIDMVILSQPRLIRALVDDDDIFLSRVVWPDRHRLVYTANGHLRQRAFDSWASSNVNFVATLDRPSLAPPGTVLGRRIERPPASARPAVLRARRVFDGLRHAYLENVDIVMRDGRIADVEPARERPGETVIDLGDITVIPGLIDVYGDLDAVPDAATAARLLSFGVTTLVAEHRNTRELARDWTAAKPPGPALLEAARLDNGATGRHAPWLYVLHGDRSTGEAFRPDVARIREEGIPVLAGNWQVGLGSGANLVLGGEALPVSPAGRRYADQTVSNGQASVTLVSAMSHAGTSGLDALFASRQAAGLGAGRPRHVASEAALAPGLARVVLGTHGSGLPPGLAQHAELFALVDAGLTPYDALKAATADAALALGLGVRAGRVAPGAVADLVVIAGDPLDDIRHMTRIVGVVRNGQFLSLGRLLETAGVE